MSGRSCKLGRTTVRYALAFLLGCLFAGNSVAGDNSYKVSRDLEVPDGNSYGEVFGSIVSALGREEPSYMRDQIYFRQVGKPKSGGFFALTNTIFDQKATYDVVGPDFRGRTFRVRLPPGEYEVVGAQMASDTGMARFQARSSTVSIRFLVGAGESIYLGRFFVHGLWRDGLFGKKIPDGGYIVMSDAFTEDAQLTQAKGAPFDSSLTRKSILQFEGGRIRVGN